MPSTMFIVVSFLVVAIASISFSSADAEILAQPTIPQNCSANDISFQLTLKTDAFGSDTSWTISNVLHGSIVETKFGYVSNTQYVENLCLPCGLYNFTIFDSYGDGLKYGIDAGYNITIDGQVVKMNNGTIFLSESTFFHGGDQCPDISLAPSSAPTVEECDDDEISVQLDLKIDDFGSETSWTISNVLHGSVVETKFGYASNTQYVENLCLPCGLYNFTIYDSYGDGLAYGNDAGYNITIDGQVVKMNNGTIFSSESTFFHGGDQCPDISLAPSSAPTVEICEDDKISFQLDLSTDSYGWEISWSLMNTKNESIIMEGSYYASNQKYFVKDCLPCGRYNFTITDSFGDGIYPPRGYIIQIDGTVIKNSTNQDFLSSDTVIFGGSNCNVRCKDSKLKMKLPSKGRLKSCHWVSKKPNRRCNIPNVATHCPDTCGTCDVCADSSLRFFDSRSDRITGCKAVGRNPTKIASRCSKRGIEDTCPHTCGIC